MRLISLPVIVAVLFAPAVFAKPLVTSSEETFQSVCLEYSETPERLIEICGKALEASGASATQLLEMKESLAWAHQSLGNDTEARRLFEDMYASAPESALALNGLGWLDFMASDYAQSAVWFEKAMSTAPEAQTLAGLGSSLYRAGALPLSEAAAYLDAALAISPDYLWAQREKAWLYLEEGQDAEAQIAFEAVLAADPDDSNANYGMAYVLSESNDWEAALSYVNRALQADPKYGSALSRRSLILLYLDRPAQALRDGEALVASWPDDSDGYVRMARAQQALGRAGDALESLQTAVERVGYESYLNYWHASMLFDDGQMQAAFAMLEPVFAQGEDHYFEHELRVQILLSEDRLEDARAALDQSLVLYPEEEFLIFYDALTLIGEKKFAAAEARFDEAAAAGLPDDELAYFLGQLVGAAQYVQAIQMRVRYSEMRDDSDS
ncbi:tetratricopeptide repeat protein [Shimia sp.]|uniref:tetratricopeptide repeat protein n=1 Tax=Shimia sp. TaxID=1954381 RepID=UPI003B8C9CEA